MNFLMIFFKKIANLIDEKPKKQEQKTKDADLSLPRQEQDNRSANDSVKGKNAIGTEEKFLDAIVKVFDCAYKGKKGEVNNKIFTLWVADDLLFDRVGREEFSDQLVAQLANDGYQTVWRDMRLESPPQNHTFTLVSDRVFLQMEVASAVKPAVKKAKISVIQGKGSLEQETYLLHSEERKKYNIGVGQFPTIKNNGFRENHIVIDENKTSPQYENNKYVSRAHAYIVFSETDGFCLQVEVGGCRTYGGRTRIFRNEKTIEVDNLENYEPLQHDDIIELGKSVFLRFEEVV